MRLLLYYVLPITAFVLILVMLVSKRSRTQGYSDSLISGPMILIILMLGGIVALGLVFVVLNYLNIV